MIRLFIVNCTRYKKRRNRWEWKYKQGNIMLFLISYILLSIYFYLRRRMDERNFGMIKEMKTMKRNDDDEQHIYKSWRNNKMKLRKQTWI